MTDFILALIPEYGLYLVFGVVLVASIGLPLPSSVVVVTSGSLAASGDLVLWQVYLATLFAFVLGDQLAFNLARFAGSSLLVSMKKRKRVSLLVNKSENMLDKHGVKAIFLSRTLFSPIGPFTGYVSGALQMRWCVFTPIAVIGASLWATTYIMAGYAFAGQLPQVSSLVISSLIVSVSAICAIIFAGWIILAWRRFDWQLQE